MRVSNICNRSLATCRRHTTAAQLARIMRDQHVGEVVVTEERAGRQCPVGIVTDRQLVTQVLAAGIDPDVATANDLVPKGIVETVLESELIYDAIWHMRNKRIAKLPVVDAHEALIGVLGADDISEFLASELMEVARITPHHACLETPVRQPQPG